MKIKTPYKAMICLMSLFIFCGGVLVGGQIIESPYHNKPLYLYLGIAVAVVGTALLYLYLSAIPDEGFEPDLPKKNE